MCAYANYGFCYRSKHEEFNNYVLVKWDIYIHALVTCSKVNYLNCKLSTFENVHILERPWKRIKITFDYIMTCFFVAFK